MPAWWVWLVAGCGLALLEVLAPAFIFLGFAIGAILTGLLTWTGLPPVGWMDGSWPRHLLVFGLLSMVAWLALRAIFGLRRGQAKYWERDINDD